MPKEAPWGRKTLRMGSGNPLKNSATFVAQNRLAWHIQNLAKQGFGSCRATRFILHYVLYDHCVVVEFLAKTPEVGFIFFWDLLCCPYVHTY